MKVLPLFLLFVLAACDDSKPIASDPSSGRFAGEPQANAIQPALEGWGAKLLALVPERGAESTPRVADVQSMFKDCGMASDENLVGRCDLLARAPTSPAAPSVFIEVDKSGDEARAIRLTACCSTDDDFFRPIASQSIIRTELLCPELTIASSESVQAFRVASTGKRDFVYAKGTRTTPNGRQVAVTILLSQVEPSDECSSLAAAHNKPAAASG